MKLKLAALLLISAALLSGCSNAGLSSNKASENNSLGIQNTVSTGKAENSADNKLQPGTTPQLTSVQKAEVNVKVGSTMNKLDESLKSIQDAKDVDLSSLK